MKKNAIITRIWHRAKFYLMYISSVVYISSVGLPDHGTKYEENPSNHHGEMCKDR